MKRITQLILVMLVLLMFAGVVGAAPTSQEEEGQVYIVKPGDGLIMLARMFYDDVGAYRLIVEATNARAETDSTFLTISDPNIILVGQKLLIPGVAQLLEDAAPEAPAADADEEMATEGEMSTPGATSPQKSVPLAGTSWILTSLDGAGLLQETTVTLDFVDEMTAGGSAGCNSYNTTYEVNGIRISFGATAVSLRACSEPVMDQEQSYLQALEDAKFYQVTDAGLLWLFDDNTTLLAEFEPASNELGGTSWEVIGYNNGKEAVVSVIIDTSMTAVFSTEGQLSGSSGCNNYTGSYTTDGDTIAIGPLAVTRKLCDDPLVMEQENAFLSALETAATYKITGDKLELRTEEGSLAADFNRAE